MIPSTIEDLLPELISWRRHLHQHPELGYEETKTQAFIMDTLRSMGLSPYTAGDTGVVVDVGTKGPRILARADIDALPIDEEADVEYRSVNPGAMHACGHDGHTAMMLGVAKILPDLLKDIPVKARLIFQPAEEKHPGGAYKMIRDGVLEGVTRVTGLHLQSEMPSGTVGARRGIQSANSDRFSIEIHGHGGHGSAPHHTIDPIPVMGQLISALQTVVSRRVDPTVPAVLTISAIRSGSAFNAIPSSAEMKGTVRTFDEDTRSVIENTMGQMVSSIAEASGAKASLNYMRGYPSVINTDREWHIFRSLIEEKAPGAWLDIGERMGGEDFAYYLHERPGVFWNLGAMPHPHPFPHHHGQFSFDESVMPLGVWIMAQTIIAFGTTSE